MTIRKKREKKELPFEGMKIYFSNSTRSEMGPNEDIGVAVVKNMIRNGANVLSENVAYLNPKKGLPIFKRNTGIDLKSIKNDEERSRIIRRVDIGWLAEATHLVAIVNGASYGVGMEIQHTINKPKMGMNVTPVLCISHEDKLANLSSMVRVVDPDKEGVPFEIAKYWDSD